MQSVAAFPVHETNAVVAPTPSKTTDVSLISLTIPVAIAMAVFVASLVAGFWTVVSSQADTFKEQSTAIASDVRDIKTRLELQSQVDEANKRADTLVNDSMKQSVDELRRQVQLLQLQYAELSKQIQGRR